MCAHCKRELAGLQMINGILCCGSAKCLRAANLALGIGTAASATPQPAPRFESNTGAALPSWHAHRMHVPNGATA